MTPDRAIQPAPAVLTSPTRTGRVYLVGAGPGDPELLTLRAVFDHRRRGGAAASHPGLVSASVIK